MVQDVYDPLAEYSRVFRDRFKEIAKRTFAELAAEAKVDVEANRETCWKIFNTRNSLAGVRSRIKRWTCWCVVLWIAVAVGIILMLVKQAEWSDYLIWMGAGVVTALLFLFTQVHPRLKSLKEGRKDLSETLHGLYIQGWTQMDPLNSLFDWDVLTRMMTETVPRLEFDPYFTTQRLADLQHTYGWDGSFNEERSVIYSHSGLINGNPFVICRTRKMEMGSHTYYGSKTIHWTTSERDTDGRYHRVEHSETLTASVTAPFPEYHEKTRVIYGNTAAPDLIFHRRQNGLAGKEGSLSYKWNQHVLKKKARNLSNADFAMMTNEEFEVAFNTSNRNNNQQFALLFTPLAQESMMKLLRDKEVGYGDDFDFDKYKMINTIEPGHMQDLNLDMNPNHYCSYGYDLAQLDFYNKNAEYFKAIYFSLAPLLCVPMYQQIRSREAIYGRDMQQHSTFWEHEALANFWGKEHFMHPNCVTDCILKTEQLSSREGMQTIRVNAYGYEAVRRISYVSKYGGDGRWHDVPVEWDEYLPVTGSGEIYLQEDNDFKEGSLTQSERVNHTKEVLSATNLKVYRRHIASKCSR